LSNIIKAKPGSSQEVVPFDFTMVERPPEDLSTQQITMLGGNVELIAGSAPPLDPEASVRKLLLDAERKAQELEEQGYRNGYEQGQKDGFEVGQRSMAIVKGHLEAMLHKLQALPETLLNTYRDWLIGMCLNIARRLVHRELATDSSQLSQLIDTLLREADDESTLTVHLHPDDLAMLEQHLDLKSLAERSGRNFTLKAVPHLGRGGCRLESDIQLVDASIEKQFELIERALRKNEANPDDILT
jgi:flagellar assembly protein FliH